MTKRYPFRRPFCSRNPRNPRHFQRIPLWILQPSDGAHHPRLHLYEPSRLRRPCRHRLRRHVYHAHFTPVPVMRKLCHLAPRPHPSAAAPIPSPPPQSCPGPRAPPKNNSPLPAPQCLPIPAISKPSLQAPLRATLPAPAESVPTPVSHSALLPAALPPAAAAEPPPRSTNRSPAARTIRTLPSSKPGSPATQTPASPGTSRTLQASPAESPLHQSKTPLPWPSELFPPGHTSPSKRRLKAPAHPLSAPARSSLLTPRLGPPHFPTQPARPRQSAPALPAKRCCCFESEMPPAPPRPVQPHPLSTKSPRAASSRIAIPPRRLAPPAPVPRSPSASRV